MTPLETAKKACEKCGACRAAIPLIMCPRRPEGIWENIKFHLGIRRFLWSLAHFDFFATYEGAAIYHCEALDLVEPLITGYEGVQKQVPIWDGDYVDVWFELTDELDDEEGEDEDQSDEVSDN